MAIETLWDDSSKTRIRIEFETSWTWDDLETALIKTDDFLASVAHSVDIIIDLEGSSLPKDFMNAAKNLLQNPVPRDNEGYRIVVGVNNMMQKAYQAIQSAFGEKLAGRDILFAQDLSQARSMLYSIRLNDK
ncbi:MAG: hypothetical protein Q9P01_03310 [Anaerolineae bacterium]|nr:hypothetical protein [Anaerolineae bacterium]MDQ7033882.1 hypothetical protein [Anaerolineae bacterium]